jgi:hypothetical protein
MATESKNYGVLAEFSTPQAIYKACEKVRDSGFKNWDSHTPFPVHGLDKAMGLRQSFLPWLVLIAGITGAISALVLMIWTSAYDYPLNIGGKPTWSIPAFIPITFEVTVLFSALTAVFGMFVINGLPTFHHPLFGCERFSGVTDDKFFIVINATDAKYNESDCIKLLKDCGATAVEIVEDTA